MRNLVLALATGAALSFGAIPGYAMPATALDGASAAPALTFVANGCGPGGGYSGCSAQNDDILRREHHHVHRCVLRQSPYGVKRVCRY